LDSKTVNIEEKPKMQQFLLPSTEGGSSQIINIPISLLSQGSQQPISFITANGQIFQIPNFPTVAQNGEANATSTTPNATPTTNTTTTTTATTTGSSSQTLNASSSSTASTAATTSPSAGTITNPQQQQQQQQALVINSQGQIISLPVLQPQSAQTQSTQVQATPSIQTMNTNNLSSFNQNTTTNTAPQQQQQQQPQQHQQQQQQENTNTNSNQQQQTVSLSQINFASLNNGVQLQTLNSGNNTLLKEEVKSETSIDEGPTIASIPNNVSGGLQTQVTHHATTVDGVNLDEIREFAKAFKLRRLALGLTQTQVGQALSATKGPAYSQSAICRFEKLDITPKSAAKIKPVLEKWMQEAELKYADRLGLKTGNQQNFADLLGSDSTKKRKRRTSFTPQALEILNEAFEKNTHPSGNQGADMTMLANKLNYDREVIRVWFCNKRQALKNTIKKFKTGPGGLDDSGTMSPSEQMSPNQLQSQLNTSSPQLQQQQIQLPIQQQQQQQQIQVQQQVQQQLQQSPIHNNVQSTVNVVSTMPQLSSVVSGTSSTTSSPKTVITLQCPNPSNTAATTTKTATPAAVTAANSNNNSNSSAVAAPTETTTTITTTTTANTPSNQQTNQSSTPPQNQIVTNLKIESNVQQSTEQSQQPQQTEQSHNL